MLAIHPSAHQRRDTEYLDERLSHSESKKGNQGGVEAHQGGFGQRGWETLFTME